MDIKNNKKPDNISKGQKSMHKIIKNMRTGKIQIYMFPLNQIIKSNKDSYQLIRNKPEIISFGPKEKQLRVNIERQSLAGNHWVQ